MGFCGDKINFNVETFVYHFFVYECFHSVMMVHHGGEFANETSQDNVVGGDKAMDVKKNLSFGEPFIHGSIPLELPQWKGGANPDVESNHGTGIFVGHFVVRDADAVNVLGQVFTRGNVALPCKATKSGLHVNGEYSVVGVDFLKHL